MGNTDGRGLGGISTRELCGLCRSRAGDFLLGFMSSKTFSIDEYGATPGVVSTTEIQAAFDACAAAGGGRVVVPAGATYVCGTVMIGARTELWVERGAVLKASGDPADFTARVFKSGLEVEKTLWIGARDADDISIDGGGVIDGNAPAFITEDKGKIYGAHRGRPAMTCFIGCKRMRIRDVIFRQAANWALHFTGCEDIVVDGVSILNDLKFPNCDGIDPDHCRNVRISNCHIEAGDDCIVVKNTEPFKEWGPTENIVVTNCTLVSTSAAIKIGTESVGDFRNLLFSNCVISRSNRALSIQLRDCGNVENVQFANMTIETRRFADSWWGCAEPIYVTAVPRNDETTVGRIRNVRFSEIRARGQNGIFMMAAEPGGIENVSLHGIDIEIAQTSSWPNGSYDIRPCSPELCPVGAEPLGEVTPWGCKVSRPNAPVYLQNIRDLRFDDVRVRFSPEGVEGFAGGIECHGVEDFRQTAVEVEE